MCASTSIGDVPLKGFDVREHIEDRFVSATRIAPHQWFPATRRGSIGSLSTWTFIYLMLILKIPIAGLLWIVWWAVHQTPDEEPQIDGGDGGSRRPRHPRGPLPRAPRRGSHGESPYPAPARTRTVLVRARHRA